jgi:hypothetical protein
LIREGKPDAPIDRGNRLLISEQAGPLAVMEAEVSAAYGQPITHLSRLWMMAGSNIIFVVDRGGATGHDAYRVEPNQRGEGKPGSGLAYRFSEKTAQRSRTAIHALALDDSVLLHSWKLKSDGNNRTLSNGKYSWTLALLNEKANQLLMESGHGRRWYVTLTNDRNLLHAVNS